MLSTTSKAADSKLREVQLILNALKYSAGSADGVWGRKTQQALTKFLSDNNLEFDGTFSDNEYEAIIAKRSKIKIVDAKTALISAKGPVALFQMTGNKHCTGTAYIASHYPVITRNFRGSKGPAAFIRSIGFSISYYLGNKYNKSSAFERGDTKTKMQEIGSKLAKAAKDYAFTRLDFNRGKGGSPAYWQAVLLNNVAMFVNLMDVEELWLPDDREIVVTWGDKLYDISHRVSGPGAGRKIPSARWPDSVGIDVVAYVFWGIATDNIVALRDGLKDFDWLHKYLQSDGSMATFTKGKWKNAMGAQWNLALHDKTLGYMIVAAHAARQIGVDLYKKRTNGANLHDAIGWDLKAIFEPKKIKNSPRKQNLQFLQRDGHGRHWGWTEVYMADFPNGPYFDLIKDKSYSRAGYAGYQTTTLGLTTCMYRPTDSK